MLHDNLTSFVETPRKFIIAELSIRKLGSSSVLIILVVLLALMKIRAYGSKALLWCFHKANQVYCIHHTNVQETDVT